MCGKRSKWFILGFWIVVMMAASPFAGKLNATQNNTVQKNDASSWLPKSAASTKEVNLETKFHPNYYPAVVIFSHPGGLTETDSAVIQNVHDALIKPGTPGLGQ